MAPSRLLTAEFWRSLRARFATGAAQRYRPVIDPESLAHFLRTRSAHIAQTSLYGYLRTRAGTRFPELFNDDAFVASINIAKWHVWLACVSDLALYAGAQLRRGAQSPNADVGPLMRDVVESLLRESGTPAEAGGEFGAHADRVRARVRLCDWGTVLDDEGPFTQSPSALVHWAPVVDELKQLDEQIVRNSVRFRWLEVREDLARLLDADSVLRAAGQAQRDTRT